MWLNIYFGAFNLLPIPPLDGWGVVSSLLPYKFNDFIYKYENMGYIVLLLAIFTDAYLIITRPITMLFYIIVSPFM